jgi:DNA-binding CsgD family transcriptional regulator
MPLPPSPFLPAEAGLPLYPSPLRHEDYLGLLDARSLSRLQAIIEGLVRRLGFDHFMFGALPTTENVPEPPIVFGTYPGDWLERYREQRLYRIDPAARHCQAHDFSIPWTNRLFNTEAETAAFYEEARSFGISAGGVCPLSYRGMETSGMGFARDQDADAALPDVFRALQGMLLIGCYAHETLERFRHSLSLDEIPPLTVRERECLLHAATGLSDARIADRLDMSVRTVRFHLANARRKLNATGRQQMVARAVQSGLISI